VTSIICEFYLRYNGSGFSLAANRREFVSSLNVCCDIDDHVRQAVLRGGEAHSAPLKTVVIVVCNFP
jgi:hypothetical protein